MIFGPDEDSGRSRTKGRRATRKVGCRSPNILITVMVLLGIGAKYRISTHRGRAAYAWD